ncbi:MAG: hypothetical protein RI558_02605 [Psychroflexus sp.]|nr:hypothetical protein [Psychroflexus sp.]MDR9448263.1 hypothetical protein [Psychroflexus sp.]
MKVVVTILLWIGIVILGYLNYKAIWGPVEFNKVKKERYQKVIEKLKDIRDAQLAHREIVGNFESDFDSLITFIDTAQYTITQRRDSSILDEEFKKTYGVDKYVEKTFIDTLGTRSVADSLYESRDEYVNMKYVPFTDNEVFEMDAGQIEVKDSKVEVFEAKVEKRRILSDQPKDLVIQEEQKLSVDDVNGKYIKVGSMKDVNTKGNWPKNYGKTK